MPIVISAFALRWFAGIKIGPEERKVYDFLFERADSEQLGVLTGDKAVTFFDAAQLPPQVSAAQRRSHESWLDELT